MVTLVFSILALGAGPAHFHESSCAAETNQSCSDGHCQTESCGGKGCGKCLGCKHRYKDPRGGCMGPMPQTCYTSRYGCYPATDRYMHRYPAFHNTYYKQAYNYRNYFDYPWHAELHEPSSQFAYETVNSDVPVGEVAPIVEPAEKAPAPRMPPQPPADAAAKRSVPKLAPVVKSNQVSRSAPQALAPVVRASSESQLAPILNAADVTGSEEEPSEETPAVSSKTMRMLRR